MPNGVTAAKKSPKTQRSGGVQGGARSGMGGGTDRVSACAWSPPRARPRKRRSDRKVGQDARARGGDQVKWGRAGVISTINPIFGVFSLLSLWVFLGGTNSGFKVNTAVRTYVQL